VLLDGQRKLSGYDKAEKLPKDPKVGKRMHVAVLTKWGSPAFYDVFKEGLNILIDPICFGLVGATKVRAAVMAMAE
tara:strand:- start:369 stop:596 length:228 start_codon:yes stop_codon:yes gene_type:complete